MISIRDRYIELDNAKGILIIYVVLGHVLERIRNISHLAPRVQLWIYLFHMPAFIFIAGLLSKKTIDSRRYEKVISYLLLFYFMKILFHVTYLYTKKGEKVIFEPFCENGIPWFCLSMFFWYLFTMVVCDLPSKLILVISIVISIIAGYIPMDASFLAGLRTINFFPFFYMGYITDTISLLSIIRRRKVQIVGFSLLLISFLLTMVIYDNDKNYIKLFRGVYLYEEMNIFPLGIYGGCARLIAFLISLIILMSFLASVSCFGTMFSSIGKRTLPIFVYHGILVSIIFDRINILDRRIIRHTFVGCFVLTIVILLVTMLPPFNLTVQYLRRIPERLLDNR